MIEVETGLWLAGNHGDGSQLKRGTASLSLAQ